MRKSIGVSQKAFSLESQHKLGETTFISVLTLQNIADSVCAYLDTYHETHTQSPVVVYNKNLGTGTRARTCGKFVYSRDGQCHIRVGDHGLNLSTILHELAHYNEWLDFSRSSHGHTFHQRHEDLLEWYIAYKLAELPHLIQSDELNFYWDRFPYAYRAAQVAGVSTDEELLITLRKSLQHVWRFAHQTPNLEEEYALNSKTILKPEYAPIIKAPQQVKESPIEQFKRIKNAQKS